jgi:hypothetical protein
MTDLAASWRPAQFGDTPGALIPGEGEALLPLDLGVCRHPVPIAIGTFREPGVWLCVACGAEWQTTEWRRWLR